MANDNNNIHNLVSESDEDTSELEILPDTLAAEPDYESESDAATHAFESLNRKHEDHTVAQLKAELRERDDKIDLLEFDLEQLRARWTGLETELKVREQLTVKVTTELEQTTRELAAAQERLTMAEQTIASLESNVRQQDEQLNDAKVAFEQSRQESQASLAEIAELKNLNIEALSRIDTLVGELHEEKSARHRAEEAEQSLTRIVAQLEEQQTEAQSSIASLTDYVDGRKDRWEQQENELRTKDELLKEQRSKIRQFTKDIKRDTKRLRKEQAARQQLETRQEVLRTDNERLGSEADDLKELVAETQVLLTSEQEQTRSLTARLNDTIDALDREQSDRRQTASELKERQQEVQSLQSMVSGLKKTAGGKEELLIGQQQSIDELTRRIEKTDERLAAEETARQEFEVRSNDLQQQNSRLQQDNDDLRTIAEKQEASIAVHLAEIDSFAARLTGTTDKLDEERSRRQALETQAAEFREQAERLTSEVEELRMLVERDRTLQHEHAELSGRVASNAATIKELHSRLSTTEGYADTLRIKLQSQLAAFESLSSGQESMEAAVATARQRIVELKEELETERKSNADLSKQLQADRRQFEEDIRTIRFELDAAQDTLTESQTVNEQLTADLIENTGFRRTLESQLAESDEEHRKESTGFDKKLKRLQQQIDEYERKITNKDAAINALLSELANKPQDAETPDETEKVVHKLADRKVPAAEEKQTTEKDRITRLLIGNIDGQELRFPLFKNKLTIGRTAHNDIQLKAQYISRRHAVVVSDDTCTRIVDWGSKNGIYVNGVRVTEKILKNGDKLTVGTARFKFEERHKR